MADYNINAVTRRVVFTGSAGLGPYAFTFEILDDDDLAVYFNTTKLTKTTDYTVTINANGTGSVSVIVNVGGNIPATPDANDTIIILGARDIERVTDFVTAGDLLASSLNEQLDSLTIFDQQVAEEQKRSMQAPVFDPAHVDDGGTLDMTLPAKDTRKGKTLQFNATTGNPEAGPTIDAVANAQTNATNAAASATAAASSATSASGSATTATTKAAEASTSAAAAAASETASAASETASAASETASAASQAAAASSASSASTSAATSTTKAAEAATSAGNASTSETNAASSATAAASSATAAAASQTAAAASAASAASAFDNFDDTYLGSKTSDPTTDNDGDALTSGDLYFNSTANEMRVYDGANWIAATSAGNVSLILYEYTATAGQTTFSGSDDNSATLSYTADNLQVVMNGVVLDPSDFTATNGTSVVLASGAALNDLVNIYAFKSFTTADMVSASAGGTFSGNVTFNANANFGDNDKAQFGAGNDLQIYHDGSNSYIVDGGAGDLVINTNGNAISLNPNGGGEYGARVINNGAVELYHDNSKKLETTSSGVSITGQLFTNVLGRSDDTNTTIDFPGSDVIQFFSSGSERMRIVNDGAVRISTTSEPDGSADGVQIRPFGGNTKFSRDATPTRDQILFYNPNGLVGRIQTNGSATSYVTSSDHRLKENVADMTGAIDRVKALAPKRFNFIADDSVTLDGFLAHEAQAVVPEAVNGTHNEVETWTQQEIDDGDAPDGTSAGDNKLDGDGNTIPAYQGIDHGKLVPLLTGALKEAIAKIETLETKVAALEAAE